MKFCQLPSELLIEVLNEALNHSTLAFLNLSRTCKRLQAISKNGIFLTHLASTPELLSARVVHFTVPLAITINTWHSPPDLESALQRTRPHLSTPYSASEALAILATHRQLREILIICFAHSSPKKKRRRGPPSGSVRPWLIRHLADSLTIRRLRSGPSPEGFLEGWVAAPDVRWDEGSCVENERLWRNVWVSYCRWRIGTTETTFVSRARREEWEEYYRSRVPCLARYYWDEAGLGEMWEFVVMEEGGPERYGFGYLKKSRPACAVM